MSHNLNYPYHHSEKKPRKLLKQVRDLMRRKHYSPRTEECYVTLIRKYIFYNKH